MDDHCYLKNILQTTFERAKIVFIFFKIMNHFEWKVKQVNFGMI